MIETENFRKHGYLLPGDSKRYLIPLGCGKTNVMFIEEPHGLRFENVYFIQNL